MCYIPPANRRRAGPPQPQQPGLPPYPAFSSPQLWSTDPALAAVIASYNAVQAQAQGHLASASAQGLLAHSLARAVQVGAVAPPHAHAHAQSQQEAFRRGTAPGVALSLTSAVQRTNMAASTASSPDRSDESPSMTDDPAPPTATLDVDFLSNSDFDELVRAVSDPSAAGDAEVLEEVFAESDAWASTRDTAPTPPQAPMMQLFELQPVPSRTHSPPSAPQPAMPVGIPRPIPAQPPLPFQSLAAKAAAAASPSSTTSPTMSTSSTASPAVGSASSRSTGARGSGSSTAADHDSEMADSDADWSGDSDDDEHQPPARRPARQSASQPTLPGPIAALLPRPGHGLKNDPLRTADPRVLEALLAPCRRRRPRQDEGDLPEEVVQKRRKNTEAARRSRLRKSLRMDTLERRVRELEEQNEALRRDLERARTGEEETRRRRETVRGEVERVEGEVDAAHKVLSTFGIKFEGVAPKVQV